MTQPIASWDKDSLFNFLKKHEGNPRKRKRVDEVRTVIRIRKYFHNGMQY